ncbi:malectin domain-containing carbohydrate-binding protein [Halomicroarcula sp. S1AR25-4]|uniref:malectin domain-containing carbohydrate-binding protein n=1 Tax=Haloarcula sp. S1AR25-4 TaxID=2950538 RepID=UPI002875F15F|nr:malectin domain-containing carbohydrate-binding protein [Halomicroarcula sp. S1AR25-4]MDS0279521.1 malectin domain-containing carbohydrate-binding protein [Halomicroarcula sp. S1AR25-4]
MPDRSLKRQTLAVTLSVLTVLSIVAGGTAGAFVTAPEANPVQYQVASDSSLYRVNAGGSTVAAIDGGADWTPPGSTTGVTVSGSTSTFSTSDTITLDSTVPDSTPSEVFQTERYGDQQWDFDVTAGQSYEVRLYFAEIFATSSGAREFDVTIEGEQVLNNYDIYADVGHDVGTMKSYTVTPSDGTLDVDFVTEVDNAKISAVEIVPTEPQPDELGASPDSVDYGSVVTGNSETDTVTLTNLGNASNSSHPDITIDSVTLTGANTSQFSHDFSGSVTLAPEESTTVNVTYSPDQVAIHEATMEVSHSGTNSPVTVNLTGEGVSSADPDFSKSTLQGFSAGNPTALEFGPDDRLYVSTQGGTVYAVEVNRTGENSYQATDVEQIDAINDIPNHDDFGNYNTGENNRQVTGLTVGGTASQPVVYVTSSDPSIDVGTDDDDTDTNSGALSRLTLSYTNENISNVDHDVMVLGLPRSEENHSPNGVDLSNDGDTLYIAQGGHTNKGAPGDNFGHTPEYALSAAILEIDLAQIEANYTAKNLQNYDPQGSTQSYPDLSFYYAIPTIQNDDATDGDDLPFGGNDGINQAKLVEGGPVQIYSPGYRNPYDLVVTESGQVYAGDHGPNGGWGGQPADENGNIVADAANVTNHPNEDGSFSTSDQLIKVDEGDYGGHAAPIRANPTQADIYDASGNVIFDINASNSPVPSSMVNPVEADYIPPTSNSPDPGAPAGSANTLEDTNGNKVLFGPTGATDEYTASNFGGAMDGDLLQVELGGDVERVELSSDGTTATNVETIGNTGGPLGLDAVGDDEKFPGTFWTANHGGNDVTIFEPVDYNGTDGGTECTGADDATLDEDGDGYDNADELDAGSDPCSSASTPADFDDDKTSNVNDPDDDNDGQPDTSDPFAVDPDDGTTTTLPVQHDLSELSLFGENAALNDDSGQGWTGLMTNGQDDYQDLYNTSKMTVGGAAEVLTVEEVPQGDAYSSTNTQQYAFQFGVNPPDEPFTVETTVASFPENPENFQSAGIFVGTGDQSNYSKLVVAADGGNGGIEFAQEEDDSFTHQTSPNVVSDSAVTGNDTTLYLTVDPTLDPLPGNGEDEVALNASYEVNNQTTDIGTAAIPASWLDTSDGSGLAVGVISTSNGASSTFPATWTDVSAEYVTPPANQAPIADAGDDQTVDEGTSVTLNATGSSDPDGDQLGYTWTQTAGPDVSLSANDAQEPTFTAPEVSSDETLTFEVNVSDGQDYDTDLVNVTVQDTDTATGDVVFAVNSGGNQYTATDGTVYAADKNFTAGSTYSIDSTTEINNTDDDLLYTTERYGDPFGYDVPVQNGTYQVTLKFAEIYQGVSPNDSPDSSGPSDGTNENDRLFNASIENDQKFTNFDIFAEVGTLNATEKTYTVEVTDGQLDIDFEATYDNAKISAIKVTEVEPAPTGTSADVTVTENGGIDASTYSGGSFSVTNTGDDNISSVQIDLSESAIPDAVFDPNGTAGDSTAKGVVIDSESGDGVGVVTTDSATVFSQPHNGVNDSEGYDVLTLEFTDFEAGETVTFSTDIDPTTIKGASTTGGAGSVSGLELSGSAVTVSSSSGTVSNDLYTDGSAGGSQATVSAGSSAAPTLGVDGVTLGPTDFPAHEAATVSDQQQNLTLSGPAGATVNLLTIEASEPPSDGYDVDAYEADNAEVVSNQTVTLDSTGQATVPVTLDTTNLNYYQAAVQDGPSSNGAVSQTVALEYDATAVSGNTSASVALTPNSGIEASTYGAGSYQVTNTGDTSITTLRVDLNDTVLPDMVFDPFNTAGDDVGKEFTLDSGDVTVENVEYTNFHNGQNNSAGYDTLIVTLSGFEPSETMAFSIDNDPTSISSTTLGSQAAGPVSGLELSGGTVSVGAESTGMHEATLVGDGSAGGSQATVLNDTDESPPSIGVDNVSLSATTLSDRHTAATVFDANQTVSISGAPANADVTLLRIEGELNLSNVPDPYEIEDYEANKAVDVQYYSTTTDSTGTATVDVTLTNSTAEGGQNYFVAYVEEPNGDTGPTSDYVILQLADGPGPIGDFENAPTDPDGDGKYEDVNGDGSVNVGDAQALFANSDDPVVQDNVEAFDFNEDGSVNVGDAQALFANGLEA